MYIVKNKTLLIFLVAVFSIFYVQSCFAQRERKEGNNKITVKEFLKGSEFALQREIVKTDSLGQKGLVHNKKHEKAVDLFVSDVIDPFNNQRVSANVDIPLDDGINEEIIPEVPLDEISIFTSEIDKLLSEVESRVKVNAIDLLNRLTVDRIITSPVKYVVIKGKKFLEKDEIVVKFSTDITREEFISRLDSISVDITDSETGKIIESMKIDALKRYDEIAGIGSSKSNIIKVEIKKIKTRTIEFSIKDKKYIVRLNH